MAAAAGLVPGERELERVAKQEEAHDGPQQPEEHAEGPLLGDRVDDGREDERREAEHALEAAVVDVVVREDVVLVPALREVDGEDDVHQGEGEGADDDEDEVPPAA